MATAVGVCIPHLDKKKKKLSTSLSYYRYGQYEPSCHSQCGAIDCPCVVRIAVDQAEASGPKCAVRDDSLERHGGYTNLALVR